VFWACVITVLQWNSKLFIISKFLKYFSLNCFRCQSNFPQTMAKWCKKVTANVFQSNSFSVNLKRLKTDWMSNIIEACAKLKEVAVVFQQHLQKCFFIFSLKNLDSVWLENGMDCPFLQWHHPTIWSNFWPSDQNRLWKNNLEKGWTRKLLN